MAERIEEYEIPKSWPLKDMAGWIKATLQEPDVTSVEIVRRSGTYFFLVHIQE